VCQSVLWPPTIYSRVCPTLSLSAGSHPFSGSHGELGSAGPSQVGVSALGYPSGQADPPDSMYMHIGGQMSTSLATGIIAAEVHDELEPSPTSSSRQPPPATAAAETAAAEGLTHTTPIRAEKKRHTYTRKCLSHHMHNINKQQYP